MNTTLAVADERGDPARTTTAAATGAARVELDVSVRQAPTQDARSRRPRKGRAS